MAYIPYPEGIGVLRHLYKMVRQLSQTILERQGYNLLVASDGLEALFSSETLSSTNTYVAYRRYYAPNERQGVAWTNCSALPRS